MLQVFNVRLGFQDLGSDGIPHLVANCLQFVETYGESVLCTSITTNQQCKPRPHTVKSNILPLGLQAEGVYRVNGNQAKIRALKQAFNQGREGEGRIG